MAEVEPEALRTVAVVAGSAVAAVVASVGEEADRGAGQKTAKGARATATAVPHTAPAAGRRGPASRVSRPPF